jgi:hypothetical protein
MRAATVLSVFGPFRRADGAEPTARGEKKKGSMSIHRSRWTGVAISLFVAGAAPLACGGERTAPKAPVASHTRPAPRAPAAAGERSASQPGAGEAQRGSPPGQPDTGDGDADDAELVVSREIVAACPTLRLVRQHMGELDQDMVWLAVLESIGECMGEGGPMAEQIIGVSGDEEHRHIVREVLETHGVAPTRVVAKPVSAAGATECQGGAPCAKRVEISIPAQ